MTTREILLVAMSGAVVLAVLLLLADVPSWGYATVFILAGITGAGAVAAPNKTRRRQHG